MTLDNWRYFSSYFLDKSYAYGKAGQMLRDRVLLSFEDPVFYDTDAAGDYLYDQKESWGRSAWLADRGCVGNEQAPSLLIDTAVLPICCNTVQT